MCDIENSIPDLWAINTEQSLSRRRLFRFPPSVSTKVSFWSYLISCTFSLIFCARQVLDLTNMNSVQWSSMFLRERCRRWLADRMCFIGSPWNCQLLREAFSKRHPNVPNSYKSVSVFKTWKDLWVYFKETANKDHQRLFKTELYTFENTNVARYRDLTVGRMSTALYRVERVRSFYYFIVYISTSLHRCSSWPG